MNNKIKAYIPPLTGVRAIAAFMVFFHHFNQEGFPYKLFRVLNEFHTGVTVFFVLSGFLICLRYYETCEITSGWFRKYIKNRIARIYPMYLLLTLATFTYLWITHADFVYSGVALLFMNIFFIRGFFNDFVFTGVAQGWSLTVEECFYFLAPFFFIQIKKNKKALWVLPICLLLVGILLVFIFSRFSLHGFFGNYTFMFLYTFMGRCIEFFLGMGLALIFLKRKVIADSKGLYTFLGLAGMVISIGIMSSLPLTQSPVSGEKFGLYHPFGIFCNNVLLPTGIAVFFYGLITEKTFIQRFLSTKLMDLLGKSSYIFYLIHIGVISTFVSGWAGKVVDNFYEWMDNKNMSWFTENVNSAILSIGMIFIILNIISIILYKCIEEPVNHYIRKSSFLEKKK